MKRLLPLELKVNDEAPRAAFSKRSTFSLVRSLGLTCGMSAAALFAHSALAQDQWTGTTNQNWATATNWSTGAVPVTGTVTFINTTTATNFPIISANQATGDLYIGANNGASRLDQTAGTLTSSLIYVDPDGTTPANTAIYNLANTAATGGTYTGFGQGTGGATTTGTGIFGIGRDAGANGTLNMNTTGTLTTGGELQVGITGTGTFNLDGGTVASTGSFVVGRNAGSVGNFNMSGGTVNASTTTGLAVIGAVGATSSGTMTVSGGSFTVGHAAQLNVGDAGTGILNVSGAGLVTVSNATGGLRLGNVANSNGTVNLNGGTIQTILVTKGAGNGTFNFNGGTLQAGAANATFLTGLTAANVLAGGAVINTNGFDVTVGQALLQGPAGTSGGLIKNGTGMLTMTAVDTYSGTSRVNAGALLFAAGASINGSLSVQVAGGGALTLQGTAVLADNSTLSLLSGATLNLNAVAGSTEVIGSLVLNGVAQTPGIYTAAQLNATNSGVTFGSTNGETLTVTAVPEPSTWALGLLGALVVGFRFVTKRHRLRRFC